jgi:hypothetical protein
VTSVPQTVDVHEPSGHLFKPYEHSVAVEHCEIDCLQVPSSHLIGRSSGQINLVGQSFNEARHEPSGHLKKMNKCYFI